MDFKTVIRTIPDFPKPGIQFRDVTTLFGDDKAFRAAIDEMVGHYKGVRIDKVAGIEARGFILGGAIAHQLGVGFVPIRKKGKLPYGVLGEDYDLEYGKDRIEIHIDAVKQDDAVIIVDDLIATGGTAFAAIKLLQRAGARVIGCCFLVDLPDLGGSGKIRAFGQDVKALVTFEGH
jgi:adenine phosphoribosyltransferase